MTNQLINFETTIPKQFAGAQGDSHEISVLMQLGYMRCTRSEKRIMQTFLCWPQEISALVKPNSTAPAPKQMSCARQTDTQKETHKQTH